MAQAPNGILGGITGKVGTVTGYTRYGRNVIRIATSTVVDKPTSKRIAQRERIKVCNVFLKAFTGSGFFTKTFPAYGHNGSGYNRAMGALINFAITGDYPALQIAYPLVLVSKGMLPAAENAMAKQGTPGSIQFNWTNNTGTGTAKKGDKTILVAYFPQLQQAIFSFSDGTRADEQATLQTPFIAGNSAETWLGFLSEDESDAANSVYTGTVSL